MTDKIFPGLNPQAVLYHFTSVEKEIVDRISKELYVTHGGAEFRLGGTSIYRYILIKPTDIYQHMFNIDREMVLIFSPYEEFEPRTLDAFSYVIAKHQKLRIERICSVLVSKDNEIESKLRELLKNDQESQVVVPFSYRELLETRENAFFFRNRFKAHFYTRDLFASEAPLKTDLYFFGRNDLVHELVNRHRSNQVSGLFGLRKTGKTSVVFGVQRALDRIGQTSVFIDCQNPAFHISRWPLALHYVLNEIKKQNNLSISLKPENSYTEEKAPIFFEELITKMHNEIGQKNILIIFDEIENITFGVSPSDHWANELDFLYFWQTLRSLFQKLPKVFSYLLVGTNPQCVEKEKIRGKDNPIYGQVPLSYIPRFDVPQTREMIRRLGKIMGLQFDEIVYAMMTEDFGGHPYLMRHVCSVTNSILDPERPARIDKTTYIKGKEKFLKEYSHFLDMILNVLSEFFGDEYAMLTYLATGDIKTFQEFAQLSPLYTNHLIGYGIAEEINGNYAFRNDTIKEHLISKHKYKKLNQSQAEKWSEISERRNALEPKLRNIVRNQMLSHYGATMASDAMLKIIGEPRKSRNSSLNYKDLFNPNISGILFSDLEKIFRKYWNCFENIFECDQNNFLTKLNIVNKYRTDAHAKDMSDYDMQLFRVSISELENLIDSFLT